MYDLETPEGFLEISTYLLSLSYPFIKLKTKTDSVAVNIIMNR